MQYTLDDNRICVGALDLGYIDKILPRNDFQIDKDGNTSIESPEDPIDNISYFIFQFGADKRMLETPQLITQCELNNNEATYDLSHLDDSVRYLIFSIYNPYNPNCPVKEITPNDKICIYLKHASTILYKYYIFDFKDNQEEFLHFVRLTKDEFGKWTIETNMPDLSQSAETNVENL